MKSIRERERAEHFLAMLSMTAKIVSFFSSMVDALSIFEGWDKSSKTKEGTSIYWMHTKSREQHQDCK